ncbi:hypothetical protein GCM10027446_23840 [Angustibacter peucedani]
MPADGSPLVPLVPPLADVLAALEARRTSSGHPPLAVLDPTWSPPLGADAVAALDRAVAAGRVGVDDLVLFTSGSSGRARGVVRSVASWTASLDPLTRLTGIGPDDVVWLPLPLSSGLALYGGFHARAVGASVVGGEALPPTATAAHLVPGLLERAVEAAESAAPQRIRVVVVAGAALDDELRARAEALDWRVVEYYGAAELSFVGWRDTAGPMRDFPGARTRLDDHGALWVTSPYLARGGLDDDPPALRRDDGWASVGDLARPDADGWRVVGRGDAAVQTGGATVVVEEVEQAVRELPGVLDVAVLGIPHPALGQLVTAVVVVRDGVLRSDLDRGVHHLPGPARPRRWLRADAVPRTSGGKVARAEVAALAAALAPLR